MKKYESVRIKIVSVKKINTLYLPFQYHCCYLHKVGFIKSSFYNIKIIKILQYFNWHVIIESNMNLGKRK